MRHTALPSLPPGALQLALLVALPAVAHLPAGVFCYWLPSAALGSAQLAVLRHSVRARAALGLPPPAALFARKAAASS